MLSQYQKAELSNLKPARVPVFCIEEGLWFVNSKSAAAWCRDQGHFDAQQGAIYQCAMLNENKPDAVKKAKRYGRTWVVAASF